MRGNNYLGVVEVYFLDDLSIQGCFNASSGFKRCSGSQCRHREIKFRKFSSEDFKACSKDFVPGRRFLPLELGCIRGFPCESTKIGLI